MAKENNQKEYVEAGNFNYSGGASFCALCGNDHGKIHFKGKLICEDCLVLMKEYI